MSCYGDVRDDRYLSKQNVSQSLQHRKGRRRVLKKVTSTPFPFKPFRSQVYSLKIKRN